MEALPADAPEPRGKRVALSRCLDASLRRDAAAGRPATAILHFLSQAPVDWCLKKQAAVRAAAFGSELVAARAAARPGR